MASYRYLVAELLTGTIRDEIPFSTATYSKVLNRPGGFDATLPLRHLKATRTNLDPARTAIYIERDGVIVWGGIHWISDATVKDATVKIGGQGFWSYFRDDRRNIRHRKTYPDVDQLAIAQDLVNYAQGQAGGDLGIVVGTETSGVLRDRTYEHYERKNIGAAVEELAAVEDGFDFAVDVAYDASGNIVKTFRCAYPRRGRSTSIVFELGANIEGLSETIDASRQANLIDGIGAGEGDAILIETVSDLTLVPPYPLLEGVVNHKDVSVPATLRRHAIAALTGRHRPVERVPTLLAHAGPDTKIGSFIEGDEVTVRGHDGYIDVDGRYRIVSYSVSIDENGREEVGLGLEPVGGFV